MQNVNTKLNLSHDGHRKTSSLMCHVSATTYKASSTLDNEYYFFRYRHLSLLTHGVGGQIAKYYFATANMGEAEVNKYSY